MTDAPPDQPARSVKRAHSFVRLSMTAEGKARVVTDADLSPSPPRQRPIPSTFTGRAAGLRRSYSAAGLNDKLLEASQGPSPKLPRASVGRSRDSRAWEFWCDPDSRNSLTTKAEQEGSGSAADAIGLIRANSRAALKSNQNKRNMPMLGRMESLNNPKKDKSQKTRPPLQRASTSYGRLQTKAMASSTSSEKPKGKNDENGDFEVPQTESDKENWEPDPPSQAHHRLPTSSHAPRRSRQILGENTEIMSQSSSLGSMLAREGRHKARQTVDAENVNPEEDEEIATFMGSASGGLSERTTLSSGEELGCVEGLLALSQGNWR